ncbi:tRNA(Ile)-lysidine synthase [Bacillus oleivorans]|uniref:tRNA(Ile)-lysidine synthase n=1 Tax=Bacillus oleivorans TaxID=1448271 RepID=A0A285D7A5_9BACI|nr:tRNA lysidine(34) synthetase TilS [Bacillus oleivorans]SNX75689.1 tRNA(Ile)-lysidine synthase [Bacillus oleivorans]
MFDQKVHSFIQKHTLIESGDILVAGVSGGPDSLALLHFLHRHRQQYQIDLVCAHVDHMFRGSQSYEDLLYVEEFCKTLKIPFEGKRIDVTGFLEREKLSSQNAARICRYSFFKEVMNQYKASKLVLAHHGDDQIETILMSLTRGSTMKGRSGIPYKRPFANGHIIRPFLAVDKKEIEDYCLTHDLVPRRDPTNEKLDYTRNRFRHLVLPALKNENPEVSKQFQRFSEELMEDEAYLQVLTDEYLNKVVKRKKAGLFTISVEKYLQLPQPLQRRGIHLILNYLYKEVPSNLSAVHIEQILHLFKGQHPSGTVYLPKGLYFIRSYDDGIFTYENEKEETYEYHLKPGDSILLPNGGYLSFEKVLEDPEPEQNSLTIFRLAEGTEIPLIVRTRRNGDRIKPLGLNGHKKIKELFIDQKIPMQQRKVWPIVTDRLGNIIWVPGLKKSCYEARDSKEAIYILRYR